MTRRRARPARRGGAPGRSGATAASTATTARRVALDVLARIDDDGAYANLALAAALDRSSLDDRDRRFVTELVNGVTRRRRALDHTVDGYLLGPVEPPVRRLLRLGAYQLIELGVPAHAAVSETVDLAPRKVRGLVNAVLRKVAAAPAPPAWPSPATELSYPDWIVDLLVAELGSDDARAALEAMNEAPTASVRADGYTQDLASQWVGDVVAGTVEDPAELVIDLCAGPGGKATALARVARVVAVELHPARARLVADNASTVGAPLVGVVVADGTRPPFRPGIADRVLVDAPCSGLGVLRRRSDARWRATAADVDRLASLQRQLLRSALELVRPGGTVTYSACTLTAAETVDQDRWAAAEWPDVEGVAVPSGPWRPIGRGGRLLPHDHDTDGMYVLTLRRSRRGVR